MCLLSSCYLFSWVILSCKRERRNKQCHALLLCFVHASASSQASRQQECESRSHFTAGFGTSDPNEGSFYFSASIHHLSQKGSHLFLNAPAHTGQIKAMRMCLLVIKSTHQPQQSTTETVWENPNSSRFAHSLHLQSDTETPKIKSYPRVWVRAEALGRI